MSMPIPTISLASTILVLNFSSCRRRLKRRLIWENDTYNVVAKWHVDAICQFRLCFDLKAQNWNRKEIKLNERVCRSRLNGNCEIYFIFLDIISFSFSQKFKLPKLIKLITKMWKKNVYLQYQGGMMIMFRWYVLNSLKIDIDTAYVLKKSNKIISLTISMAMLPHHNYFFTNENHRIDQQIRQIRWKSFSFLSCYMDEWKLL